MNEMDFSFETGLVEVS